MGVKLGRLPEAAIAMLASAIAMLALAASASASLTGAYTQFAQCPYANPKVVKCLYAPIEGGEVVLGSRKVAIVNSATLQGGFGKANGKTKFASLLPTTNGATLSAASQPISGGLAGVVAPQGASPLVKAAIAFFFENALVRVDASLELAKPAESIQISESQLASREGTAIRLPVRIHLENPFLGSECYVGSATSPIVWELTTGITAPPGPNKSIRGSAGELELVGGGAVLSLPGAELVDNAWSAPSAHGCGGPLSFLVDPMVNSSSGLPSAAGRNTAILKSTINVASSAAVRLNDEENP